MRKELFAEDEFYHIYDRGVDRRNIFHDDRDRLRFINALYILNNFLEIPLRFDVLTLEPRESLQPIEPLVEIVAGCLMPNHYHLFVTPKKEKGISQFFHKFGTSYVRYFNIRHERTGRLFESSFKAKHVDQHEYAAYLTQYIHLNPLKVIQAKLGSLPMESLIKELVAYPWSSLPDYLNQKSHFSKAINTNFRNDVLDFSVKKYHELLYETLQTMIQA
jgi:putative transposase